MSTLAQSESTNKLRRISNLKPNAQQDDRKKDKRNQGLLPTNSLQNHTSVTAKTPGSVNFVSSQSERTVTTDVEARSAALINTQRHNISNITQSINTNTTKFGSAGQNALCSTERFSEEVRYKQSQKSLNAAGSDNLSQ